MRQRSGVRLSGQPSSESSRSLLLVAAVSAFAFQPARAIPDVDPGCRFSVTRESTASQILGAESIGVPIRILQQPDSPVAIIGADLRQMTVTVGSSGFEQHGTGTSTSTIEIRNISDRLLTRLGVAVQTRTNEGGRGRKYCHVENTHRTGRRCTP
jgi:hypothetical protein